MDKTLTTLENRIKKIESLLFEYKVETISEEKINYHPTFSSRLEHVENMESRVAQIEEQVSIPNKSLEYQLNVCKDLEKYMKLLRFRIETAEKELHWKRKVTIGKNTDGMKSSAITEHCPIGNSKVLKVKQPAKKQPLKKSAKSDSRLNSTFRENLFGPNLLEELSNDFNSMFIKGISTDVNIKCGSEVLKAHKNVLCARSSVFEAMFSTPKQEIVMDSVVIDDIESEILHTMLTFMYSGRVEDLNESIACDLLYAAEKYQINGLKQVCVQYLKSLISVDNAFYILHWGNLYDEQLKTTGLIFISQHFSILKKTDEWHDLQLNNPTLAIEVYGYVVEKLQKGK